MRTSSRRPTDVLVVAAACAGYAALLLVTRATSAATVDALVAPLVAFVAALLCADAALSRRGSERWAWTLLAAGATAWSAGEAMASIARVIAGLPAPASARWLEFGATPVCLIAVLLLSPAASRRASRIGEVVDGLLISAAVLFVAWATVLGPLAARAAAMGPAERASFVGALADVLVVSLVVFAASRVRGTDRRSLATLAGGLGAIGLSDVAAGYLQLHGHVAAGHPARALALAGFLLVAAAARRSSDDSVVDDEREMPSVRRSLLPYVPAALAAAVAVLATPDRILIAIGLAVGGLFVLRQVVTIVDHIGLVRELDRRVDARTHEVQATAARFRSLVRSSSDVVTLVSADGRIEFQSESIERVFGLGAHAMIGLPIVDWAHPTERERLTAVLDDLRSRSGAHDHVAVRLQAGDGRWRETEIALANLCDDESVGALVMNVRDVSERNVLQRRLNHQLVYDSLTGLPNRAYLTAALTEAIGQRFEPAVIAIDVDRLGDVNQRYGQAAGDAALRELAGRLKQAVRSNDVVARLGGDEFAVVVLPGDSGTTDPAPVIDRITAAFAAPVHLDDAVVSMSATVGLAAWREGQTAGALLAAASTAQVAARAAGGRGGAAEWNESLAAAEADRFVLAEELHAAVEADRIVLVYEPTIELASGRMDGVQALVRWPHPTRGMLDTATVLRTAETSGLVGSLTWWTLEHAAGMAASWNGRGAEPILGVRLSGSQVRGGFPTRLAEAIEHAGLPPRRLRVEVTIAGGLVDDPLACALAALRDLGVQVAADAVSMLTDRWAEGRPPADYFLLGREVVERIGRDGTGIASSLISLAHAAGIGVLAEAVTDGRQADVLLEAGCDLARGPWFGHPLDHHRLGDLLNTRVST